MVPLEMFPLPIKVLKSNNIALKTSGTLYELMNQLLLIFCCNQVNNNEINLTIFTLQGKLQLSKKLCSIIPATGAAALKISGCRHINK